MPVCVNMEQCLTNGANKQRLIIMFICALHCAVYEQFGKASDDTDVLLVQTSLQIADTYATVMIAEYMDLLVLLLLSTLPSNCHDVYIVPGRTNASNIQRCQEDTGPCLCHNILFAHAYGTV